MNNPEVCFSRRRFPGFVFLWKTLNSDPVGLTAVCCACVCVSAPPGQVTEVCLITRACGDALFYYTGVG